jgi:hypothetical protein
MAKRKAASGGAARESSVTPRHRPSWATAPELRVRTVYLDGRKPSEDPGRRPFDATWINGCPELVQKRDGGFIIRPVVGSGQGARILTVQIDARGEGILRRAGVHSGKRIPRPIMEQLKRFQCFYTLATGEGSQRTGSKTGSPRR